MLRKRFLFEFASRQFIYFANCWLLILDKCIVVGKMHCYKLYFAFFKKKKGIFLAQTYPYNDTYKRNSVKISYLNICCYKGEGFAHNIYFSRTGHVHWHVARFKHCWIRYTDAKVFCGFTIFFTLRTVQTLNLRRFTSSMSPNPVTTS